MTKKHAIHVCVLRVRMIQQVIAKAHMLLVVLQTIPSVTVDILDSKARFYYILFAKSREYSNIINHSISQTNVINLKQLVLINQVI